MPSSVCVGGFRGWTGAGHLCSAFAAINIILFHLAAKVCSFWDLIVLSMCALATFSDGCLGSNTDEGRSEV